MQKLERRRTKSENFGKSKQLSLFVQKNEKPVEQQNTNANKKNTKFSKDRLPS